jgi:hypothetical protein
MPTLSMRTASMRFTVMMVPWLQFLRDVNR